MAKKDQTSETKVTRISASDSTPSKTAKKKPTKSEQTKSEKKPNFVSGFFGYFKGAWFELKQVRWPTRVATWGLTAAVLGFSAFFVIYILLLDAGFKYLFEQLLK